MEVGKFFGGIAVALILVFFFWILSTSNTVDRIVRTCEPVYFIGKPFASLAKLGTSSGGEGVENFFMEREKDCRFVVYDMFYAKDKHEQEVAQAEQDTSQAPAKDNVKKGGK